MADEWMILLQLLIIGSVIAGLLTYLLRSFVCKARNDVSNKSVLITGCDSGIGHELAKHLDSLGFLVFAACLDTSCEGAQRLRIEASSNLRLVNMDVTNEDHVRHAVDFVTENLPADQPGLYALINNAGICVCGEFEWQTFNHIQHQVNVNILGTMRVTRHCIPLLKAAQGRIVNVSSIAGVYGYPGLSVYSATKHAMEGFSAALRHEMRKFNVSVVTVQPGDFSKATHLLDNHHRNMNEMWNEMSDETRFEYKDYFVKYHSAVAKTGITGKRIKPVTVLPKSVITGLEKAILTKVPEETYLILPTWSSYAKMALLTWLPDHMTHSLVGKDYRRSWESFDGSACSGSRPTTPISLLAASPSTGSTCSAEAARSGANTPLYPGRPSPPTSVRSFGSGRTTLTSSSTIGSTYF